MGQPDDSFRDFYDDASLIPVDAFVSTKLAAYRQAVIEGRQDQLDRYRFEFSTPLQDLALAYLAIALDDQPKRQIQLTLHDRSLTLTDKVGGLISTITIDHGSYNSLWATRTVGIRNDALRALLGLGQLGQASLKRVTSVLSIKGSVGLVFDVVDHDIGEREINLTWSGSEYLSASRIIVQTTALQNPDAYEDGPERSVPIKPQPVAEAMLLAAVLSIKPPQRRPSFIQIAAGKAWRDDRIGSFARSPDLNELELSVDFKDVKPLGRFLRRCANSEILLGSTAEHYVLQGHRNVRLMWKRKEVRELEFNDSHSSWIILPAMERNLLAAMVQAFAGTPRHSEANVAVKLNVRIEDGRPTLEADVLARARFRGGRISFPIELHGLSHEEAALISMRTDAGLLGQILGEFRFDEELRLAVSKTYLDILAPDKSVLRRLPLLAK